MYSGRHYDTKHSRMIDTKHACITEWLTHLQPIWMFPYCGMWEVWVEWWSRRNGCFVVIDGNEPHLYMEVQTSGTQWFMRGEWMWEWLTGNENGRLLVMWERERSGLEWVAGLVYGIEHGRCHGRKHNHYKLDETPKDTSIFHYFFS